MLKCNSKEVKQKINNYIMESWTDWAAENNLPVRNIEEVKKQVLKIVFIEKLSFYDGGVDYALKHFYKNSFFEVFDEWMRGLNSVLDCSYIARCSAVDFVGALLEETETEKNRFTEEEAESLFTKLLYNNLIKNININKLAHETVADYEKTKDFYKVLNA